MAAPMQLLLEALRTNFGIRNNDHGLAEDQMPDEMSGFILENVQVATLPFIESDDEDTQDCTPNPLLQLVHKQETPRRGGNPKSVNKLLNHIAKLEKKVQVLEKCIPPNEFHQRLWLAPTTVLEEDGSHDGSDYYRGGNEQDSRHAQDKKHSGSGGSKSPPRSSPKAHRVETRPVRLEKDEKSCFARLLFSRCWTGKDHSAGWKIKRKCPTHNKVSLSCPCGTIGPCQKVKANPVPIDQIKSSKKKTKSTASSLGSKLSRKQNGSKKQKNAASPSRIANFCQKPNGKLLEKFFPCCFKNHVHGECCCRCRDNPTFHDNKEKVSGPKASSAKQSASESRKITPPADVSASPSEEDIGDEGGSDYDERQSNYETYNIHSISSTSPQNEKINYISRKQARGDKGITSKNKTSVMRNNGKDKGELYMHKPETINSLPIKPIKSTTSFQIMLHPDVSEDQIEPEVVSHQILKTLSTIHGPVKVEQKIVVQGTKNSVVIVTHGETCQCNLCQMLKGKMHPTELVEGLGPQIVKISTDSGCNTLINHSDGCTCELCRVLDPAVTKDTEHHLDNNDTIVMVAGNSSNESTPEAVQATSTPVTEYDNSNNKSIKTLSLVKKSKYTVKKKVKKCRCTKCRQRRRVEKLKLRLKKEIGAEEYERNLREITRHVADDQTTYKRGTTSVHSGSEEDGCTEPRRIKRVSFSDEPGPKHQAKEEFDTYDDLKKGNRKCKLCEMVGVDKNDKFKMKKGLLAGSLSQNYNSTVYSVGASSHEILSEYQTDSSHKEMSEEQLKSESKTSEKGYRLISEEQNCFPPRRSSKKSREKRISSGKRVKDRMNDFAVSDENQARSNGKYGRQEDVREGFNLQSGKHSPILLSEGGFPQKFVYWSPGSRSNVAAAYSSESYYAPDQDEFPIVNVECKESTPSTERIPSPGESELWKGLQVFTIN